MKNYILCCFHKWLLPNSELTFFPLHRQIFHTHTHTFISLASHALLVFHAQPHTLSFSFKLTVTHSETLSVFSTKSQSHTRHPHTQSHTLIHTPHSPSPTRTHTHALTPTHSHTRTKSLLLSTLCYFLCGLYWLPPFSKLLFTARMVPQIPLC